MGKKTGGRKKGVLDRATKRMRDELALQSGLMPLGYMLAVLRDPNRGEPARLGCREGGALLPPQARVNGTERPQFPNKSPPALVGSRFCGRRRLRRSFLWFADHLLAFVVAHGESRQNRVQPERVAPPSCSHGASPPFRGTALDMASRVGNARFSLIRRVHARAPGFFGARRGSSPGLRLRRPGG